MILTKKYWVTASLIITAVVTVCKKDNLSKDLSPVTHQIERDHQNNKALVIKTHIAAYKKEFNTILDKENELIRQNAQLDIELVRAEADNSNSVEAGMNASFQEGITVTLKKRNQKDISALQSALNGLHAKYNKKITDMGYDVTEFEQLISTTGFFDNKISFD